MSAVTLGHDEAATPHALEKEHLGPAPKRIVTGYGFWIFILSDMVMFSCFFAAFAVLSGQTAGGPHASNGRGALAHGASRADGVGNEVSTP